MNSVYGLSNVNPMLSLKKMIIIKLIFMIVVVYFKCQRHEIFNYQCLEIAIGSSVVENNTIRNRRLRCDA